MIAIIDYGMGNLRSVLKALDSLGEEAIITRKHSEIEKVDKLILPGVGAFPEAMKNLRTLKLVDIIRKQSIENKKPFLGICLGMQLLAENGFEIKESMGLGLIPGKVIKLEPYDLKIPHVGWNNLVRYKKDCKLFKGLTQEELDFYFVHSYHFLTKSLEDVSGVCNYGKDFTAVVSRDNIYGVQFHPEKSQRSGLKLLTNFIDL